MTVTLAIASFTVALAAAVLVVDSQPQSLLGTEQGQGLETTLYVIAFAVILPLVLIVVPRLADAIASGPNARGLPVLAAFFAATLAGSVFLAEAALGGGTEAVLAIVGMWSIGAAALLARAARPISWGALLRCAGLLRATAGFSSRRLATDARVSRRSSVCPLHLIFLPPNQQTEVLMRSERANELPFGDPQSDSWIGSRRFPAVATPRPSFAQVSG